MNEIPPRERMKAASLAIPMGALITALLLCPALHAQPLVARAASVSGTVLLAPAGGGPAFALTSGYALNFADRIDTRGGGRVVIDISDGSVVVVQPGTLLWIKDFHAAESLRELFEITVGMVRVKINHFAGRPNPYRMNSPTASIAVRGTEFSVAVGDTGETTVDVYEGAVQVSSRSDPSRSVLVEGGHGVLVRQGDELRIYSLSGGPPIARQANSQDRDRRDPAPSSPSAHDPSPSAPSQKPGIEGVPLQPSPDQHAGGMDGMQAHTENPWRQPDGDGMIGGGGQALVSTYDRYLGTLAGVGYLPFSSRYVAHSDRFSDAFDNPALATRFDAADGRFLLMPVWNGGQKSSGANATPALSTFSLAPQATLFAPTGGRWVAGGGITSYRIGGSATGPNLALSDSTAQFFTGSGVLAARVSANDSAGFGVERFSGSGDDGSAGATTVNQTRLSAGYSHDFGGRHQIGVVYRHGWIYAGNSQSAGSETATGTSNEASFRIRGALTQRLLYGVSGAFTHDGLGESLIGAMGASLQRRIAIDRSSLTVGAAYLLGRRTVLSLDLGVARSEMTSSARVEQTIATDREASAHVALERDLTRRFFVEGAFLAIARTWRGATSTLSPNFVALRDYRTPFSSMLYPHGGRFSDFGAGWRVTPNLTAQYLFSTDYGVTGGLHAVVLRYTLRRRE